MIRAGGLLADIPSPPGAEIKLGSLPLRGYALMIILGVIAAVIITDRRLVARGHAKGLAADIATWAVPFGIVGARIYHVITDPELYFTHGKHPIEALEIWNGGLGIWGGVVGGALGAYIAARRRGISYAELADAVAPGLVVAQAIGRWGNWFNQELYGRETGLPWALHITKTPQTPGVFHYQPTFLYESLWCLGVALLCIWAQRRYGLAHGRVFALYVAAYCAGRFWIESLRVDTAHRFFGLRLNDYVSIGVFLLAVAYLVWRRAGKPGGPAQPPSPPHDPALAGVAATEQSAQSAQPNQSAQSAQSAPSARSVPGTDPP
jgi:prolipoprotein diacylglyceryl transferase